MDNKNINKTKSWSHLITFFISYIFFVGIFQTIGIYLAGLNLDNFRSVIRSSSQNFTIQFFSLTGTVLIIWLFRKYNNNKTFISLGFSKNHIAKDLFFGVLFGVLIMFSGFICLLYFKQIEFVSFQLNIKDLLLSFGVFIFVALTEELLFRGYILSNLMDSFNKYVALTISAIFFSLMHAPNPHISLMGLIAIAIAGFLFGLPYIYNRSLWFPIALHFSWNFCQGSIFGFNVSGTQQYSLINTIYSKASLWNGGAFGFEGSVLCVFLSVVSLFLIYVIFRKRESSYLVLNENN